MRTAIALALLVALVAAAGTFWGAAIETDIGDGATSFMPTARAGQIFFTGPESLLHISSAYLIGGAGMREIHGEPKLVVRTGLGFQLLPLLYLAEIGLACPDVFEVVADVGGSDAVASLRMSWGL